VAGISAGVAFVDIVPRFAKFAENVSKTVNANVLKVAGAAAAAVAVKAGTAFADWGGKVKLLTRELGISAKEASRLAFVGRQVGLDVGQLSSSFGKLSKLLASNDDIFGKLGVTIRGADGRLRSFSVILSEIADKFKSLPDGPEKTALALQLFGKQGKELIPLLNKGSAGFAELAKQADRLGFTLSDKGIEAVSAYKKAQKDLSASLKGFELQLGQKTLPVVTFFTRKLVDLTDVVHRIPAPVVAIGAGGVIAAGGIATFAEGLNNTVQATKTVWTWLRKLRVAKAADVAVTTADTAATATNTIALDKNTLAAARNAAARTAGGGGGFLPTVGKAAGIAAALYALGTVPTEKATKANKNLKLSIDDVRKISQHYIRDLHDKKIGLSQVEDGMSELVRAYKQGKVSLEGLQGAARLFTEAGYDNVAQLVLTKAELDKVAAGAGQAGAAFEAATPKILAFAGMTGEKFTSWRFGAVSELTFVKASLGELSTKANVTATQILAEFERMLRAQRDYAANFAELVRRGLPEDFRQQLADMGVQGAGIVDALAHANHATFNRIVRDWEASGTAAQALVRQIGGIPTAIAKLPGTVTIDFRARVAKEEREERKSGIGMQHGGIVPRRPGGTLIRAGEGRFAEAIVPLSGSGFGNTVHITVEGNVTTERQLVQAVREGILQTKHRNGRAGLA
jgi:hypothetical protein